MTKIMALQDYIVFFDFDNTITNYDVFDDMIMRFSVNDKWKDLEEKWRRGKIGSRECLEGQIKGVKIGREALDNYLSKIEIDPYFKRLIGLFDSRNIKTVIVSDNFDYILERILKNNGIADIDIYSNKLRVENGRLAPSFPFVDKDCKKCAHCKRSNLSNGDNEPIMAYIGDGLSDVCASKDADIVFAKGYLKRYYEKERLPHIPFKRLKEVYDYFTRSLL